MEGGNFRSFGEDVSGDLKGGGGGGREGGGGGGAGRRAANGSKVRVKSNGSNVVVECGELRYVVGGECGVEEGVVEELFCRGAFRLLMEV